MTEERNYEAEAEEQGWNPDFDGPNKVDAKTFVEKGEKIAGMATARAKKLEHRIEHLEQSNREFGEYHKKTLESQRQKTAERIAELEGKVAQAITDGDGQEYTRAHREIESLKETSPAPTNDAEAWGRMSQDWMNENDWYSNDRHLRIYADGLADEVRADGFNGKAYFKELTRRVKEDNPDKFKNPAKAAASAVEGGGQLSTGNSKEHTYDDLPPDAKKACDDFVKQGFMSQEDYLSTFEFE